jgi:hypothetical protein
MKIRDLKWRTIAMWPPEWLISEAGAGEEGILEDVKLRDDLMPSFITISANHLNDSRKGIIVLDEPAHLQILYRKLKDNIGRSLTAIGDLDIDFLTHSI